MLERSATMTTLFVGRLSLIDYAHPFTKNIDLYQKLLKECAGPQYARLNLLSTGLTRPGGKPNMGTSCPGESYPHTGYLHPCGQAIQAGCLIPWPKKVKPVIRYFVLLPKHLNGFRSPISHKVRN